MGLSFNEKQQALIYASNDAMFMYRANIELSKEILNNGPAAQGMSDYMKQMLIIREWINIDSDMVIKYCKGILDKRNSYLFDKGDIKVIPEPYKKININ